ncbi:excinuclease ABC subunit UvrA [Flammeovirga kamogawensis]|uniref:UvrABC system protein A n=1 Tax=Flammeovirga kamogawensis TaxID=373891 RepID=A0ABX8GSR7_9BACT|nr:excinuclease ABC subunit UvrA [Flammeovirga kamogawensis]TRX68272.1 excinuclease ABC subunit UvrA [Flammeovirga kamogawensis]
MHTTLDQHSEAYIEEEIAIYGARENNLKNFDLKFPRNSLVVITGVSGSGKSSLAFDTIYAEGQRRYMESFSAYARSFIGNMERPDVDKIEGLSPVISIEQKTTSRNPRSTVGTTTEIYDFLRLLYARTADAFSYITGEKMIKQTEDQIIEWIMEHYDGQKMIILAPVIKGRKGHYRELFVQLRKQGYSKVRIDGEITDLVPKMQVDRYKTHDIEVVIDRVKVEDKDVFRINQSIKTAMKEGKGIILTVFPDAPKKEQVKFFSKFLMDPKSGISYDEPAPNIFSFNSPYGACKTCNGLGEIEEITQKAVIPDPSKSIFAGGIIPLGEYRDIYIFKMIEQHLKQRGFTLSTPISELSQEAIEVVLYGSDEEIEVLNAKDSKYNTPWITQFEGVIPFLKRHAKSSSEKVKNWAEEYTIIKKCPTCDGARLKKESLHFKIAGKNIAQLAEMDIQTFGDYMDTIDDKLTERQRTIGTEIIKELKKRTSFLINVGLEYLTLNRSLKTLSGGEAQRIRLATQIGTQLVGVLYILDEPSIGLHQRDNIKLIKSLQDLRDLGNSVIVVEHDKDMMLASDYILDIGPKAGLYGGNVVAAGTPSDFLKQRSTTADFLSDIVKIEIPKKRREGNGHTITLKGANGNNLRNVSVDFPLGKMICITGVSGSGKSTLIHDTLYPILNQKIYRSKKNPKEYKSIEGLEFVDKVIEVDQSPIGRTPRSNPATYTDMFSEIRTLFTNLPESKIRGYKPGRFSFNVKGGRCETCQGGGKKLIEMDFLPDVYVDCEECKGKRYNRETLEIRYKGKSISDILNMTVDQGVEFFEPYPKILRKLTALSEVGLGYITLGQHATTLSGGEAQRVKLATELSKKDTGKTFYILDEPTTGLHFEDIQHLLNVLHKLVDKGNTVLVIEHNLDVIKVSDHIIDLGPEGGRGGGMIVTEGTPEKISKSKKSYTAKFLKEEMR